MLEDEMIINEKKYCIKVPDSERQRAECWTRCIGYFRPYRVNGQDTFNPGKMSEVRERKYFKEPKL